MLERLIPKQIDNTYHGQRAALWIFGLVVALKTFQSLAVISTGFSIARDADGIPLDTYTVEAATTAVALFAQGSLWRLTFCILSILVLAKYRSAIPIMFSFFALNYLGSELVYQIAPLTRVGAPPGPVINFVAFILMVLGLVLSLRERRSLSTM